MRSLSAWAWPFSSVGLWSELIDRDLFTSTTFVVKVKHSIKQAADPGRGSAAETGGVGLRDRGPGKSYREVGPGTQITILIWVCGPTSGQDPTAGGRPALTYWHEAVEFYGKT